jgi:hypothetical protein
MGRKVTRSHLLWTSAVVVALTAMACSRREGAGCPGSATSADAVDEPLLAFLSAARSLHHEADTKLAAGDAPGAVAALERLIAMPAPSRVEVAEVLADTHARLAELRLGQGDIDGGAREVQVGLERVQGATYFRGHLLEVSGLIEEARASALADAGKGEEAARVRARAVGLLEEAVEVQERVIDRALGDGGRQ